VARARKRFTRKRKTRGDWVYRGWEESPDGDDFSDHETYGPHIWTSSSGLPAGGVLYDSRNYLITTTGGGITGFNVPNSMATAARAESGRRPLITMVQGYIFYEPTTWAAGTTIELGAQIGIWEQDRETGDILTPSVNWTMWEPGPTVQDQPAVWQNAKRQNQWMTRIRRQFSTSNDQAAGTIFVRAPMRARLAENECLAILLQASQGGVDVRGTLWLRSYVSDHN